MRTSASSRSRLAGLVMVFGVLAGMPLRTTISWASAGLTWASRALPTPVQCGRTRRPTSVKVRSEWCEGDWAT